MREPRTKILFIIFVVALAVLVVFLFDLFKPKSPESDTPVNSILENVLTIDLTKQGGSPQTRASGFINIIETGTDGKLFTDLKPTKVRNLWSVINANSEYSRFPNTKFEIIIGGGVFLSGKFPGDGNSYVEWDSRIDEAIRFAETNQFQSSRVIWDIWSEADVNFIPQRSKQQFFSAWEYAYKRIKAYDANAQFTGPSFAFYKEDLIKEFLYFAREKNVIPQIISWHENDESDGNGVFLARNVAAIKPWLTENEFDQPIDINEYLPKSHRDHVGILPHFLAQFERAKVTGAKSCWWVDATSETNNECVSDTINGLLTENSHQVTSKWQVYKAYADLAGKIVETTGSGEIDGIAAVDGSALRVVLGRAGEIQGPVRVTINSAGSFSKAQITGTRLPWNNGDTNVSQANPPITLTKEVNVVDGKFTFDIPDLGKWDAYKLDIAFAAPVVTSTTTTSPTLTSTITTSTTTLTTTSTTSSTISPTITNSSTSSSSTTISTQACDNLDVNGDNQLTLSDLSNFGRRYKQDCLPVTGVTYTACGPLDTNLDGKINLTDLSYFARLYKQPSCIKTN